MRTERSAPDSDGHLFRKDLHYARFTQQELAYQASLGREIRGFTLVRRNLHSAKGGAVETGCSDLYDAIY